MVIVGLVSDAGLAGGNQTNPFNFQNFGMSCIKMKLNGTSVPRGGYSPNFANEQYLKTYKTLFQEFECDINDYASVLPRPNESTDTCYNRLKSLTVQFDLAHTVHDSRLLRDLRVLNCFCRGSKREYQGDCVLSNDGQARDLSM